MSDFRQQYDNLVQLARGEDTTAGAIRQSAKPETKTAPNHQGYQPAAPIATTPPNCGTFVQPDPVNSPAHYQHGGIETIEIIRAMLTDDEFRGYLKGNIIKYRERAPYKGKTDEDYAKAKRYWDWLKES